MSLFKYKVGEEGKEDYVPEDVEGLLDLRVAETVDSYQGREKELVIYSVTSHYLHKALEDYRRVNVAFSRAKSKLIIISSLTGASRVPWLKLIKLRSRRLHYSLNEADPDLKLVKEIHGETCKR